MNIAVVGSYQESMAKLPKPIKFEIFDTACKAIGKALGNGNHRLIVAHRVNPHEDRKQSAEAIALSRRAKLGVSCRVKVPVGRNSAMNFWKG